jgi:hypothetical protein
MPVNRNEKQVNEKKLPAALVRELSALNLDDITPLAALNLVSKWKKLLADNPKTPAGKAGDTMPSLFD